jgi:C-terminal processing protease CtpA/Prc
MMKGAAADAAGVRQGDELVAVDGRDVTGLTPFQAAGLLSGASSDAPPTVSITVRARPIRPHALLFNHSL